jgi:formylglycine-generating enzyme required for sulfatase activity
VAGGSDAPGEAEAWRAVRTRREKRVRVIVGLVLAEARALLARWGTELPAEITEFVSASRRAARWRRFRLWGMVASAPAAVALIGLVVWAGLVWWGVHQVEAEWATKQEFVRIPYGCFEMGSPDRDPDRHGDELPVHQVCVKPFDLSKYGITQGEWRRVMIFPNTPEPSLFKGNDRRPVEMISWNGAERCG